MLANRYYCTKTYKEKLREQRVALTIMYIGTTWCWRRPSLYLSPPPGWLAEWKILLWLFALLPFPLFLFLFPFPSLFINPHWAVFRDFFMFILHPFLFTISIICPVLLTLLHIYSLCVLVSKAVPRETPEPECWIGVWSCYVVLLICLWASFFLFTCDH